MFLWILLPFLSHNEILTFWALPLRCLSPSGLQWLSWIAATWRESPPLSSPCWSAVRMSFISQWLLLFCHGDNYLFKISANLTNPTSHSSIMILHLYNTAYHIVESNLLSHAAKLVIGNFGCLEEPFYSTVLTFSRFLLTFFKFFTLF